jgi:Protein of unknown function (DUF3348)
MTQAAPYLSPKSSRLVRLLNKLEVADTDEPGQQFTERLAQLIDLPASIKLASSLSKLQTLAFEPSSLTGASVTRRFLESRASMVESIVSSFTHTPGPRRISLPVPQPPFPADTATACEPYLKFYRSHQRKIDFSAQQLHLDVREAAAGLSPELARLAALDAALEGTLSTLSRGSFAGIPRLLTRRFEQLLQEILPDADSRQDSEDGWKQLHQRFRAEIQEALLAETDARLLPALGLVEAINSNTERTPYE